MMMIVKQSIESELSMEKKELGENLPQSTTNLT
jgi:hypothetical protein